MNRKEAIRQLEAIRNGAEARLHRAARGESAVSTSVWPDDIDALTAGIEALEAQEVAQQPTPLSVETRMRALNSLLTGLDLSEKEVSFMEALMDALDAGVMVSGSTVEGAMTVTLLADRQSWATHYYYDSDYPDRWLYKKLLLVVIPAICPELREPEEEAETND